MPLTKTRLQDRYLDVLISMTYLLSMFKTIMLLNFLPFLIYVFIIALTLANQSRAPEFCKDTSYSTHQYNKQTYKLKSKFANIRCDSKKS